MPRARHATAVVVCAVAAAACGSLLGIQDRSLDTSTDASGDVAFDSGPTMDTGAGAEGATDANEAGDAGDGAVIDANFPDCGTPCPLATGLDIAARITSDPVSVYWTEFGDTLGASNGFVKGCPVAGCGAGAKVYAMGQVNPVGIATDGQSVYWATAAPAASGGGIWSCPVAGCSAGPKMLAAAETPADIAIDATYVYWVDQYDSTVHRVLKAGGASDLLWDASTGGVNQVVSCAVDDASVYLMDDWTDLLRVPVGGGAAFTINSVTSSPPLGNWILAIDSTSVYYGTLNGSAGAIVRASKSVAGAGSTFAAGLQQPWAVTVDRASGAIYYADFGSGADTDGIIGKVPADGGQAVPIVSSLVEPIALTISGNYVFWVSQGMGDSQGNVIAHTGSIYRAPK